MGRQIICYLFKIYCGVSGMLPCCFNYFVIKHKHSVYVNVFTHLKNFWVLVTFQFHYAHFVIPPECHKWLAVSILACLRRGPRGYFHWACFCWRRVDGSTTREPFRCAYQSTDLKYCYSNLRYDPTGNRAKSTSFSGPRLTHCTTERVCSWHITSKNRLVYVYHF